MPGRLRDSRLQGCVQFYTERLKELRRRILEERNVAKDKTVPSAFVTFK